MNDQQLMQEMLTMQNALQTKLHPQWKQQPWDQAQAIIVETGELLDALGFKWWKHSEIDYDNVRIELIDIWHFMMNCYLIDGIEKDIVADIQDAVEHSYTYEDLDNSDVCINLKEFLAAGLSDGVWRIDLFLAICLVYGMDLKEIYWVYMIKNTLNMFRWNNGYLEGTYKKDWNGCEDNAVMMEIYGANKDMTFKELYKKLEWHYANKVADRIILP